MHRSALALLTAGLLAAFAAPAVAAPDVLVASDPLAQRVTALDGTVVWVSGKYGHQTLMRATGDSVGPVTGAPETTNYRTADLGHDRKGRLVLTYLRCKSGTCTPILDDLAGHRTSIKGRAPKGCTLTTAPAYWGTRSAYGLSCSKASHRTSGLYVKVDGHGARRLTLPKDARKYRVDTIAAVDLRGTRVAAVAADIYSYAFTESVSGKGVRSIFAAASEGDSDEHVTGLALGNGGTMWALTDAEHAGDPLEAIIFRLGSCQDSERLVTPAGTPAQEGLFRATGLAVDGDVLYLIVPGIGVVTHTYAPGSACTT